MKNFLFFFLVSSQFSFASSVDWTGNYRFEYFDISKTSLDDNNPETKSYGVHFLTLKPRIVVSDGIQIHTRLDFLSNKSPDYANSQIGQTWGGSDFGKGFNGSSGVNNTTRSNQVNTNVKIRELFLKVEEEYGALLLGRAPYEFGLGMTHNAGNGAFDHWFDTRDMIAYKFFMGNMTIMPMISRSYDRGPGTGDLNQDQLIEFIYDNKDIGAKIGLLWERKNASQSTVAENVNSAWATALNNGSAATATGKMNLDRTSFLFGRNWETVSFELEAIVEKGDTGYSKTVGEPIELNASGFAAELEYKPKNSKLAHGLWFGMASGDNPSSTKFEGFQFDRNYDVAMLMFNHRLGQQDFLRTNIIKNGTLSSGETYDDEAISNATYLSYRMNYDWKDRWKLSGNLTYAQIMDKINSGSDMKKDLGLELDIRLIYQPRTGVQWVNEVGLFSPGSAFKNGTADLENQAAFGFASKAAISF
ncbi:MAG: alginate export family protein [Bdellovibrionales bacterium]